MKKYESPNAEFLLLDDVITASTTTEPCSCQAFDGSTPTPGEHCKMSPTNDALVSRVGI